MKSTAAGNEDDLLLKLKGVAGFLDADALARMDLDALSAFALGIGVGPKLLDTVTAHGLLDRLSGEARSALAVEAARTALWNQGYVEEARRISESLRPSGIPHIFVRGPIFALRAYGDPLIRRFADLDLLVQAPDLDRVVELLGRAGYQTTRRAARDIRKRGWKGVVELARDAGERSFDVDVHSSLLNRRRLRQMFDLDGLDIWSRMVEVEVPGAGDLPAMSPEDSLICAAAHVVLQHDMSEVRSLIDCALFLRKWGDRLCWRKVSDLARRAGLHTVVSCLLNVLGRMAPIRGSQPLEDLLRDGRKLISRYPLSVVFAVRPPSNRRTAARWLAEREAMFFIVDRPRTAIRVSLFEAVPSRMRVRRIASRKLGIAGRLLCSIPLAVGLPIYTSLLFGHAVLMRSLD